MGWGGEDWKTLFITTVDSVLAIDLLMPGVPLRQGNA
ncbi:hypothetical protein FB595_1491 [Sphingobium sp. AEW010]|nr:hypothetical protein [Sphingobium sp. JAI105]TWC96521.1 hypothetical protein FB595_1491 [Sphingobium sp. AEW010]TWD16410.1 hypothetical protein FB596_1508 [Sphingobium sp. AEW013]TWD19277.1 hypothetical protein FB594_1501 [Sphingobium sp. AEW001]